MTESKAVLYRAQVAIQRGPVKAEDVHPLGGLNQAVAAWITERVGTMWCAYVFTGIGAGSLVGVITGNAVLALACGAISSYVLQLVLLPVIMVGQRVQQAHSDARAEQDHTLLAAANVKLDEMHARLDRQGVPR